MPNDKKMKKKKAVKKVVKKVLRKKLGRRKFNAARLGNQIGGYFGPRGGKIGAEAGRMFRELTGFGDYKITGNTLMTSPTDSLPRFKNVRNGTRVRHREYLFDVVTSSVAGQFKLQSFPIQPGLITAFPWLAASAENYDEWQPNGIVYEFKSNSYNALASTNTASGTVVMTTNYNVLNPPFANKMEMEQYDFSCSAKPSVDLLHPVECDSKQMPVNILNIRSAPVLTGDARLYDLGTFNIATVGMQGASTNIGELWVTYDITFYKPKLGASVDVFDHYVVDPTAPITSPLGTPFGPSAAAIRRSALSDLGTTIDPTTDTITFPANISGNFLVIYMYILGGVAAASTNALITYTYGGGVAPLPLFGKNFVTNLGAFAQTIGIGGSFMTYNQTQGYSQGVAVRVSNGGTITFGGGTGVGAASTIDVLILALPTTID